MGTEKYEKELERIRRHYFSLSSLPCPILDNQAIHFNQQGFRHFLRRKGKSRPINDQLRRFSLFRHVVHILSSKESTISDVRVSEKGTIFWAIQKRIGHQRVVKVVIRKTLYGVMHYYSVRDFQQK